MGNRYNVVLSKKGQMMFTALKMYANKKREDKVVLSQKQVSELKKAKGKDAFFKLVDKYVVGPCNLGSKAKKAGLTKNTGYDAAHYRTAKVLGIKV